MRNHKMSKKIIQRVTGGMLACLMLWGALLEPLSAAGVTFIRTRQLIESYERMNPVSWQQVDVGTPARELELPDFLRAIVPLKDVDMDLFEQAQPLADTSGGSESYDYYYYGYVAPRNKEELYKNGELAVYTIYYAGKGDAALEVASKAYRVYGSLNGGENSWFACEEDGTITGQVQNVLMTWDTSDYDSDTPGTYEITGEAKGYSVESADAMITVDVSEDTDTVDAEEEHTNTEDGTVGLTAGAASGTENVPETEKTPGTEETPGTTGTSGTEETPGTGDVPGTEGTSGAEEAAGPEQSADTILSYELENPVVQLRVALGTPAEELELPDTLSAYVIPEGGTEEDASLKDVPVSWNTEEYDPAAAGIYQIPAEPDGNMAERETAYAEVQVVEEAGEEKIIEFELSDPAAALKVPEGTAKEALALPSELKAVLSFASVVDDSSFAQAEPSSEELEKSGYSEPENAKELRQEEKKVVYAFSDEREDAAETEEASAWRVYGSLNGGEPAWYACDAEGNITGRVQTVGVNWNTEEYDGDVPAVYRLEGEVVSDYPLGTEAPYAVVTVLDMDCTCGVDAGSRPWEHSPDCPQYEPVQCMCDGEHDESNRDCPLYGSNLVEIYRPDGETKVLVRMEDLEIFREKGFIIPDEPVVHYAISLMAASSGANDEAQNSYMKNNTSTIGNPGFVGDHGDVVPGEWIDYLNTMWRNKMALDETKADPYAGAGFVWARHSQTGASSAWSGEVASVAAINGVRTVSTAAQLRYALVYCNSGETIKLAKNIDLNGYSEAWASIVDRNKKITLDGNGYTIYNLGIFSANDNNSTCFFVDYGEESCFKNLSFSNIKLIAAKGTESPQLSASLFGAIGNENLENISVSKALLYGGDWIGVLASHGNVSSTSSAITTPGTNTNKNQIKNCYVDSSWVYGRSHVGAFSSILNGKNVKNSYVKDCLVISTGQHSGTFISCLNWESYFANCFVTNSEIYAAGTSGGFTGSGDNATFKNCFTSGIIEGYYNCGGFIGESGVTDSMSQTFENCYSTTLVGLRRGTRTSGGFIGTIRDSGYVGKTTKETVFKDCYAAGEVGDYTMDMDANSRENGGFIGVDTTSATASSYTNCYYDKQTTAMREWTTGSSKITGTVNVTGEAAKPRGVLTSTTVKGGVGLASGAFDVSDTLGFAGFTYNYLDWSRTSGFYPQLRVFSEATVADWGNSTNVAIVKNASKASASTVILDTWDTGYDWGTTGVRSTDEVSYNRDSSDYAGGKYTYDTVREIVSDAIVSSNTWWTERVAGGAPTDVDGDGQSDGRSLQVNNDSAVLEVLRPGLNWYQISTSSSETDTTAGKRPIRLASLVTMDAGQDKTVKSGSYYDHKDDATFTMLDTITENLVVGEDDSEIWSTSKKLYYPQTSTKYYNVPLKMDTGYSIGSDTRIYTEIWRAKKEGNNWVADTVDVRVTGISDTNSSEAQKRWNGSVPMYTDISTGRTYIIKYYWKLKDGRYITDSKTVTVVPNTYDLNVYVRNASSTNSTTNGLNSSALYLESVSGRSLLNLEYTYPTSTSSRETLSAVPYTENAAAFWKTKNGYRVVGLQVDMKDKQGTTVGTAIVNGTIEDGTEITIPVTYPYYSVSSSHEYAYKSRVNVTYTVKKDNQGGYQLVFNKLLNVPSDEAVAAKNGLNDSTGISATSAYINDIQNDITVTLYVERSGTLTVAKQVEGGGNSDEVFDINVTLSSETNGGGTLYNGDVTCTIGGKTSVINVVEGKLSLHLKDGESAAISGIPLPYCYKVQESSASSANYTVTYNIDGSLRSSTSVTAQLTSVSPLGDVTVINTLKTDKELTVYKFLRNSAGSYETSTKLFNVDLLLSKKDDYSDQTYEGEILCSWYERGILIRNETLSVRGGKVSFQVQPGKYYVISQLPTGYYYKVEEQASSQKGYIVSYEGEKGQLLGNSTAYIYNEIADSAVLTVTKKVDAYKNLNQTFDIDVTLSSLSGGAGIYYNGTLTCKIGGVTSTLTARDGKIQLHLKDGESAVISGIPLGYYYKVEETSASRSDYVVTYDNNGVMSELSYVTGQLSSDTPSKSVTVNNTLRGGKISIFKQVVDITGTVDKNREYRIDLTLSSDSYYSDVSLNGSFEYSLTSASGTTTTGRLNFTNGKATVVLKAGQTIKIENLPLYYYYMVEEQSSSRAGFEVKYIPEQKGQITSTTDYKELGVVNWEKTGTLEVSKEVNAPIEDPTKVFDIDITLTEYSDGSGAGYNGTVSYWSGGVSSELTFKDGEATAQLTNGDSITIYSIPLYYHYKVVERDPSQDGYSVQYVYTGSYGTQLINLESASGQFTDNSYTKNVTVTNTMQTTELTVTKEVQGAGVDKEKEFDVDIRISKDSSYNDNSLSGTFVAYKRSAGSSSSERVNLIFKDGRTQITLKSGDKVTITGLPYNYYYEVDEQSDSQEGFVVTYSGKSGPLSDSKATITNTVEAGALTISKEVRGVTEASADEFDIIVRLSPDADQSDQAFSDTLTCTGHNKIQELNFVNGEATVSLKQDESVTIQGIPAGYRYQVLEKAESQKGYDVTYILNDIEVPEGNCTGTIEKNSKDSVRIINAQSSFAFVKVAGEDRTKGLSQAEFKLYRLADGAQNDAALLDTDNLDSSKWILVGTQVSDPTVEFTALTEGTYRLVETRAPDERVLPKVQWNVIVENGEVTITDTDGNSITKSGTGIYQGMYLIANEKLYELPNSGGMGTYLFTIGGIAIMMTALLLFIKYKRKEDEREQNTGRM